MKVVLRHDRLNVSLTTIYALQGHIVQIIFSSLFTFLTVLFWPPEQILYPAVCLRLCAFEHRSVSALCLCLVLVSFATQSLIILYFVLIWMVTSLYQADTSTFTSTGRFQRPSTYLTLFKIKLVGVETVFWHGCRGRLWKHDTATCTEDFLVYSVCYTHLNKWQCVRMERNRSHTDIGALALVLMREREKER